MPEPDTTPTAGGVHVCDNCEGIDAGSCLMNPDRTEPDNPAAIALARHIADHPLSAVLAATRLLGWRLTIRPAVAISGRTETGATIANVQVGGGWLNNVHPANEPYAYQPEPGFTWAQSVASHGTGPTVTIDIDIHAPGHDEPVPVEINLADARTLHAMLGGVLTEHGGEEGDGKLRERYAAAARTVRLHLGPNAIAMARRGEGIIPNYGEADRIADAVLAVRDQEMDGLRMQLATARTEAPELTAAVSASTAAERRPVCQGFVWIGQPFTTCERCGQPAWEHAGEDVAAEGAGPFDSRSTVKPWGPGEADRLRARWAATEEPRSPADQDQGGQ